MSHNLATSATIGDLPKSPILSLDFANIQNSLYLGSINFEGAINLYNVGYPNQYEQKCAPPQRVAGVQLPGPCSSLRLDGPNRVGYISMGDGKVVMWSIDTNQLTPIGEHLDICNNVRWCPQYNVLVTSGMDGFIKYWDPRTSKAQGQIQFSAPLVAMDTSDGLIVCGTNTRKLHIIDIRNPLAIASEPKYKLDHHLGCLCAMKNNEGYVYSTYEGRAQVEVLRSEEACFPFRAHRASVVVGGSNATSSDANNASFPFSHMTCHTQTNILATAGCDGTINLWDFYGRKKRSHTSTVYNTSISTCAFSPEGKLLVYATGYNYYAGAQLPPWVKDQPSAIHIAPLTAVDLKVTK